MYSKVLITVCLINILRNKDNIQKFMKKFDVSLLFEKHTAKLTIKLSKKSKVEGETKYIFQFSDH